MTVSTVPSRWMIPCSFGSSLTAQIGENVAEPGSEWPMLRQWVGRLFARSTPRRPMGPWNPYNPRDRPHWGVLKIASKARHWVGVVAELENIVYSSLRTHGVVVH